MIKQRLIIDYVKNGMLIKDVALANNFVFRAYEIYRGVPFIKNEHLQNIIKVILTEGEELEQLTNGIEYNGKKYISLITSPSMQKKEESADCEDDENTYKTEYLFIIEEEKDFVHILEKILSGNKIDQFEKEKKEMCLVKDIVARLGLATSGTTRINYNPKIVIVDEGKYTYKNNYTILEKGQFKEVDNYELEHILNDGGGLMSNWMADIIAKEMDLDYRVDFAAIRQYKALATKGLVLRFDFATYMKEHYKNNTDNFICENGIYKIRDMFDEWHNIDDVDLILNESMVKWIKNWESINEIEQEYSKEEYKPYLNILNILYVTKTNHNPNELKTHTKVNYQVLQNVCCTEEDLKKMAKDTIDYYSKLVHLDEKNIDSIRIAFGDIAKESGETTITNKMDFLFKKMHSKALKLRYVEKNIAETVTKKIKQLAGGKMYLKGGYKLGALDPVTYCNWLMTRDRGDNGLKEQEFYVASETGNRVFYRNPIALYQEIKQITITDKLDNWLSDYTPELIFFNAFDDTLSQASGADLDGDGFGIIENDTLYNCVIKELHPFINIADGKSVAHEFTREQLYKDIIASSGNIIGSIAISNSKLCSQVTRLDNIVIRNNNTNFAYTYRQLRDSYFQHKGYEIDEDTKKEQKEKWNKEFADEFKKIKENEEMNGQKVEITKINKFISNYDKRDLIKQLFRSHKEDFFYILYASQLAIDMPKTLTPIPEDVIKKLDKYMYIKKPVFMHYLGKCSCKGKGSITNCKDIARWADGNKKINNVMDIFCQYVIKELLVEDLKKLKSSENSKKLINLMDYNCEDGQISEELKSIYADHKEKRNYYLGEQKKADDINVKEEFTMILNRLDVDTLDKIERLNISNEDIVATLKDIKSVTVRFILTFLWNTLKTKVEERNLCDLVTYREDKNGDIDCLFKKYSKIENPELIMEVDEILKTKKDLLKKLNKNGLEIRIGGYEGIVITDEVYVKDKYLYRVADNTNLGYIFPEYLEKLTDGQVLKINDNIVAKNGKSVTLFINEE